MSFCFSTKSLRENEIKKDEWTGPDGDVSKYFKPKFQFFFSTRYNKNYPLAPILFIVSTLYYYYILAIKNKII